MEALSDLAERGQHRHLDPEERVMAILDFSAT
jgi:hypothetical protein